MFLVEVVGAIGENIRLDVQVCVDTEIESAAQTVLAHIMSVEAKRAAEHGFTVQLKPINNMVEAIVPGQESPMFFGRFRAIDVVPGPDRLKEAVLGMLAQRGEEMGDVSDMGMFTINAADPVGSKQRLLAEAENVPEQMKPVLLHIAGLIEPSMTPEEVSKVVDDALHMFNNTNNVTAH